jgi:hypothetical protein
MTEHVHEWRSFDSVVMETQTYPRVLVIQECACGAVRLVEAREE